jgi:hypothetical protein
MSMALGVWLKMVKGLTAPVTGSRSGRKTQPIHSGTRSGGGSGGEAGRGFGGCGAQAAQGAAPRQTAKSTFLSIAVTSGRGDLATPTVAGSAAEGKGKLPVLFRALSA